MNLLLLGSICESPDVLKAIRLIQDLIKLAVLILPAILIIFSTIDIGKAVINADASMLKDKIFVLFKRLILIAILFFVPAIVNSVTSLLEDGAANITHSYNTCFSNTENIEYYEKLEEQKEKEKKEKLNSKTEKLKTSLKKNTEEALKEVKLKQEKYASNVQYQTGTLTLQTSIPQEILNANAKAKLEYLFPGGTPSSPAGMQPYLTTVPIAMTKKDGTKYTGKITVHKTLAKDVQDIFQIAQNNGFKIYDTYSYSFRRMNNGSGRSLSHHSYGVAIDINPNENYSRSGSRVYAGQFWSPSRSELSIPKDGVLVQAFKAKGWKWGGDWKGNYQDYMHFSFTGN